MLPLSHTVQFGARSRAPGNLTATLPAPARPTPPVTDVGARYLQLLEIRALLRHHGGQELVLEAVPGDQEVDQGALGLHLRLVVGVEVLGVHDQTEFGVVLHLLVADLNVPGRRWGEGLGGLPSHRRSHTHTGHPPQKPGGRPPPSCRLEPSPGHREGLRRPLSSAPLWPGTGPSTRCVRSVSGRFVLLVTAVCPARSGTSQGQGTPGPLTLRGSSLAPALLSPLSSQAHFGASRFTPWASPSRPGPSQRADLRGFTCYLCAGLLLAPLHFEVAHIYSDLTPFTLT